MTIKLNQILAIEKNVKTQLHQEITELHHATQKPALMNGLHRSYTPKTEQDEKFPDEGTRVQHRYQEVLEQVGARMARLFDVTGTKDWGNTIAKADVKLDGQVFMEGVPVPFLLFMEKELHDLRTFVDKIVELDPGDSWTWNEAEGIHRSAQTQTFKTRKAQRPIVLYQATEQHPAQTQLITEDIVTGHWEQVKFSGAIPRSRKLEILERIGKLEVAVKFAREEANATTIDDKRVGQRVLDYCLKGGRSS